MDSKVASSHRGVYIPGCFVYLVPKMCKKSPKNLVISISGINNFFKIDRKTLNRALHELENFKMIVVERHTGRSPKVTIEFIEKLFGEL